VFSCPASNSVLTANRRVPHISLVFREMWDTRLPIYSLSALQRLPVGVRVSHISRKTSEIPGFPVRSTNQRPRVRLSLRKAA